jgi:hypothetical protein
MKMNNFLIQQTARAVGRFMTALAAGVTTGILVLAGSALLREASAQITVECAVRETGSASVRKCAALQLDCFAREGLGFTALAQHNQPKDFLPTRNIARL